MLITFVKMSSVKRRVSCDSKCHFALDKTTVIKDRARNSGKITKYYSKTKLRFALVLLRDNPACTNHAFQRQFVYDLIILNLTHSFNQSN